LHPTGVVGRGRVWGDGLTRTAPKLAYFEANDKGYPYGRPVIQLKKEFELPPKFFFLFSLVIHIHVNLVGEGPGAHFCAPLFQI